MNISGTEYCDYIYTAAGTFCLDTGFVYYIYGVLFQKWTDEYLQWDPSEYGDISTVKLPSDRIWMPDIELYNT